MTLVALTHVVGSRLAECEVTFVERQRIDVDRARRQHDDYRATLRECGADVRVVEVSPESPDAVFVEDAAVALDELVVAAAMGAASRRAEVDHLMSVLEGFGTVVRIALPGTLEGGDVLRVGRTLYVGRSARTTASGVAALAGFAEPLGYRVVPVAVTGCLHLKTAVTALDEHTLLANPAWVDVAAFDGRRVVPVPDGEPFGANTLRVGTAVVLSRSHPATAALVTRLGYDVRGVDVSELEKAEAGVSCLAILIAQR